MSQSCAEADKAQLLQRRAEGSELAQAQRHDPGVIARRIERLKKDRAPLLRWTTELEERDRRLAIVDQQIAQAEEELKALGGLPADSVEINPGDIIRIHGWTIKVTRVNRKTIAGVIVGGGAAGHDGKWDRSRFQEVLQRAEPAPPPTAPAEGAALTPGQKAALTRRLRKEAAARAAVN